MGRRVYREATGEPLAFIHADIQWNGRWREPLRELVGRLRSTGIKLGIFYLGNADDQTNEQWVRHAEERFVATESDPALNSRSGNLV